VRVVVGRPAVAQDQRPLGRDALGHLAAGLNRPAEAQLLLDAGADPNHEARGQAFS
jgi:hypothetical protein